MSKCTVFLALIFSDYHYELLEELLEEFLKNYYLKVFFKYLYEDVFSKDSKTMKTEKKNYPVVKKDLNFY